MTFTPLERAALDGLAWELSAIAPDLAGQITESLPGQRRVQGPVLVTEAIVDRRRPNPPETTTGRLGTIHVQIDHLEHPIAFQAELLNGRLIALHGDAYGQDLAAVRVTGDVVDQVFRLRPDGHPVPFDLRDREEAILETSALRRLQTNPDPSPADPRYAPVPAARPSRVAAPLSEPPPKTTGQQALDALFGKKTGDAARTPAQHLVQAVTGIPTTGSTDAPAPLTGEDVTSVRIGLIVLAAILFGVLVVAFDMPFIFAGVIVFWIARLSLKTSTVEALARAVAGRRMG